MFKKVPNHNVVSMRKKAILEMLHTNLNKAPREKYNYLDEKILIFFLSQLRLNIQLRPVLSVTGDAVDHMIEERRKKQNELAAEEVNGDISVPIGNHYSFQHVLTEGTESQTAGSNEITKI